MKKKQRFSYSKFQGAQMLGPVMELLLSKPELLDQMPDVTPEFRQNYEAHRERMGKTEGVVA